MITKLKSKLALDIVNKETAKLSTVLIVIPRLVLINNWKQEIKKWGWSLDLEPEFVTYKSFPDFIAKSSYNYIIFDECHHLSERCLDAIDPTLTTDHAILLSATINKNQKQIFKSTFLHLECIKVTSRQAIDNKVLPDPTIYLIPLLLDNTQSKKTEIITKGSKKLKTVIDCDYNERFKYKNQKNIRLNIHCTQRQYYNEISEKIEWYKKMSFGGNTAFKNMWLQEAGKRLKWLSDKKMSFILDITLKLMEKNERFLVFCNNIDQTKIYGNEINCKTSSDNLIKFNNHEINNISACNMLDEGEITPLFV